MEMKSAGEDAQFTASTSDPTLTAKRTKRRRSPSPPFKPTSSTATSSSSSGIGAENQRPASSTATTTTTSSSVYESSTEEEEDMANCLILLAQGRRRPERQRICIAAEMKFSDIATTATTNKAGFCVYDCKTCNRSFPSFQALGGHRAGHKKPRTTVPPSIPPAVDDTKVVTAGLSPASQIETNNSSTAAAEHRRQQNQNPPMQLTTSSDKTAVAAVTTAGSKVGKVHECAICGAEFASGQALGGHMRRHRASNAGNLTVTAAMATATATAVNYGDVNNQERNVLPLDLNLPAPEDLDAHHHRGDQSKFQFGSKKSPAAMVFTAPALVGCHY